jgi:hypothetical protein
MRGDFELIAQIDDYVFGYARREVREFEGKERGWSAGVVEFFQREIDAGNYPLISCFIGDDASAGVKEIIEMTLRDGRFDRGLECLLNGIEANLVGGG